MTAICTPAGPRTTRARCSTHLASAEAWLKTVGDTPVNLKYLIEGEEEVGSEHLEDFIEKHKERLACDCVVISDNSQFAPGQPAVTYGLRGLSYFELFIRGPRQDLHSGVYGGAVVNPAVVLSKLLASLIDDKGRVTLAGFYDEVAPLTAEERAEFAALPFDEEAWREQIGVPALGGEEGYSAWERKSVRPTFDVNGIKTGYQGEGAKTVLPARASAKFSFRLVPHQKTEQISAALKNHLAEYCPPQVTWELKEYHAAPGFMTKPDGPLADAARRAIEFAFGARPVFVRDGGSIPVVNSFKQVLGVDTLLLGWGLDDDNTHSPNEKFNLADFHRGAAASAQLWHELAQGR